MTGLTERRIREASAKDGEVFLWDDDVRGFGCRIKPSGAKVFLVQRKRGPRGAARTQRVTIGHWPVMKVEKARIEAIKLLAHIADGADPAAERRGEREAMGDTVQDRAKEFIEKHAKAKGRRSWHESERIFTVYVNPTLGKRPISDVKRRDIIELLDDIADRKAKHPETGEAVGGPIMANRVLAAVRKLFNWAIARDIIETSPVVGIERPGEERKGKRVLSDAEIREIWAAADTLGYPYGYFVKALLLTGRRRTPVAQMRRSEIDANARVWNPPPSSANKEAPELPLFTALEELLDSISNKEGDFVFKGRALRRHGPRVTVASADDDKPINSFAAIKDKLDAAIRAARKTAAAKRGGDAAKVKPMPEWDLQRDVRRTVRTRLGELGVSDEIAGLVMGHDRQGIKAVYDHSKRREEKRRALELWGQALARILDPAPTANVVVLGAERRA